MKIIKLLLLSGFFYAGMTAYAHAEPISFAIFSALYTIGIPGAIANAISLIAVPALVVGASILGRQKVPTIKPSDAKNNFETGESTVMEGIGRVRVGGLKAFGDSDGSTRARLICRLQGQIDAIEEYFIGGREVTVDPNGDVTSPPWARPSGSWANWQDKAGDGTETAWSSLLSLFPSIWTSSHRVRGIAQSLVLWYNPGLAETKYFTLYQGGVPDTEQLVRASKIYDPRSGLTVWSDNGILATAHVLRHDPAFTFDMFDWDKIASEATRADALVATKTGTEKRARAWGIWGWESPRADVLQQLLDSIGAEVRMTEEGKIWLELIDDEHESEIDFTPADGYEITWRGGPEAVERPNTCRLTYYSPERNYDLAEIDLTGIAWAHVEDEITRYGSKYYDLELNFCPSASQAQRIARRKFAQARGDTGVLTADMVGLGAWGLLYGSVELPDLGDVLPVRLEPPRIDDDNGTVEIPFAVWPSLPAWNQAVDEAVAPEPIPELGYETDVEAPNAPTAVLQVTYPNGSKELRVDFSLPVQDYTVAEANFRTYAAGLPDTWQSMDEYPDPDDATFAYVAGDYLGVTIDSRVRVFNGDEGSYFSPLLNAVVGVDNSVPPAPSDNLSAGYNPGDGASISGTAWFNVLRGVAIQFERRTRPWSGAWGSYTTLSTTALKPGQAVSLNNTFSDSGGLSGIEVEWRIRTLTSDGTAGTEKTFSAFIPGE